MNCQVCQKEKKENVLFYPETLVVNLCDKKGKKWEEVSFDEICLTCADHIGDIIVNALKAMVKEHEKDPKKFDEKIK